MIEVQSLHYRAAGKYILYDVTLELRAGEIALLQGANGAGKSTLLKAILLPELFPGKILYEGKALTSFSSCRHFQGAVSYLGHEPGLYLDLTALENMEFFLKLHLNQKMDALQALKRVGLEDACNEPVRNFSRGMQQRLAFARIFYSTARVLFLDEPLNALDGSGIALFQELLSGWISQERLALVVSHSEEPLLTLAHRFLFMKEGQLRGDIERARYSEKNRQEIKKLCGL